MDVRRLFAENIPLRELARDWARERERERELELGEALEREKRRQSNVVSRILTALRQIFRFRLTGRK